MPKIETLNICIEPDGSVYYLYQDSEIHSKADKAKALQLPSHGRLIDADVLKKEVKMLNAHYNYRKVVDLSDIDNAPTIIEAEEGE